LYFVNIKRLWSNILGKSFRLQHQRLVKKVHGSQVYILVVLTKAINGKGKKREALNPEPGTQNLLTQTDEGPISGQFRGLKNSTVTPIG